MKNGNLPAMPIELSGFGQFAPEVHLGLTKREQFAAQFMAAWIIHNGAARDYGYSGLEAAKSAVEDTDALLAELERTK